MADGTNKANAIATAAENPPWRRAHEERSRAGIRINMRRISSVNSNPKPGV
jgi:hypothetical protein